MIEVTCGGMEWIGVDWSDMKRSGMEWSGIE